MKAVMPVAGLGSRFTTVGITKPKPLIEVGEKPMVKWAADSLPFINDDDFVFIVRQAHVDEFNIGERLQEIFSPSVDVIVIDSLTAGPACTARIATEVVSESEPVVITDSDHYFESEAYCDLIGEEPTDVDGAIPVFESKQEGLSYSAVDEEWHITRIKEKEPISPYANIGAYYFSTFGDFLKALDRIEADDKTVNDEYYVAPTYNELIADGKNIVACECDTIWSLGTPESVERFEQEYL